MFVDANLKIKLLEGGFVLHELFIRGTHEYFGGGERSQFERFEYGEFVDYFLEVVGDEADLGEIDLILIEIGVANEPNLFVFEQGDHLFLEDVVCHDHWGFYQIHLFLEIFEIIVDFVADLLQLQCLLQDKQLGLVLPFAIFQNPHIHEESILFYCALSLRFLQLLHHLFVTVQVGYPFAILARFVVFRAIDDEDIRLRLNVIERFQELLQFLSADCHIVGVGSLLVGDEAFYGHICGKDYPVIFQLVSKFIVGRLQEGGIDDAQVNFALIGVQLALRATHVLFYFIEEYNFFHFTNLTHQPTNPPTQPSHIPPEIMRSWQLQQIPAFATQNCYRDRVNHYFLLNQSFRKGVYNYFILIGFAHNKYQRYMSRQEELQQYEIDKIFFIGTNVKTNSVTYVGKHKETKKVYAIRFFNGAERPPYVQWCESKLINNNRQVLPYYPRSFQDFIGQPDLQQLDKLKLMHKIATKLAGYHAQGPEKIHGNIHPNNILVTLNLKNVEFVDSLKGGNRNTYYSSPESFKGINHQASDIYSLGLLFLELLDSRLLEEELLEIKKPPHKQPLFPEDSHLKNIESQQVRQLLRLMLNRNYLQRITASEIVSILRAIILNFINNNQKQKVSLNINHISEYFQVEFNLIPSEKKKEDTLNSKLPIRVSDYQRQIFAMYTDKQDLIFSKKEFTFIYLLQENTVQIIYNHPSGLHLEAKYRQSQLPRSIREKNMGLRLLMLILSQTPAVMFELCLSGKLIVRISNNYQAMYFGGHPE